MSGLGFLSLGPNASGASGLTAAGSVQADALRLPAQINEFDTVDAGAGCVLPGTGASDATCIVVLNRGANGLMCYPPTGGQIDARGVNVWVEIDPYAMGLFFCFSTPFAPGAQWYSYITAATAKAFTTFGKATIGGVAGVAARAILDQVEPPGAGTIAGVGTVRANTRWTGQGAAAPAGAATVTANTRWTGNALATLAGAATVTATATGGLPYAAPAGVATVTATPVVAKAASASVGGAATTSASGTIA